MRALAMDFPDDPVVRDVADQYMFGPAMMVSPVTEYKARTRDIILPGVSGGWFDFWTGQNWRTILDGHSRVSTPAALDEIPLHIRAGSIIPMGPDLQYTTEKKADPLTVWVYAGADGDFMLQEDDGLTYGYEKGESSRIVMHWSEKDRTLTIGKREGSFPGMLQTRTVRVIFEGIGKAVPFSFDAAAAKTVTYGGAEVKVSP